MIRKLSMNSLACRLETSKLVGIIPVIKLIPAILAAELLLTHNTYSERARRQIIFSGTYSLVKEKSVPVFSAWLTTESIVWLICCTSYS
jgi:hypothetical protein